MFSLSPWWKNKGWESENRLLERAFGTKKELQNEKGKSYNKELYNLCSSSRVIKPKQTWVRLEHSLETRRAYKIVVEYLMRRKNSRERSVCMTVTQYRVAITSLNRLVKCMQKYVSNFFMTISIYKNCLKCDLLCSMHNSQCCDKVLQTDWHMYRPQTLIRENVFR
jgi:hypothetical protein